MDRNLIRRRFGWGSRKIALYAGNLGKGHSFGEILAAAAYFRHEDRNDWLFVISTHGEQRARLAPQAESLPNVSIIDYVAEAETSALLSAATVHVVTMRPGWEGIIVPSKTYSCLRTRAPILYVGPVTSDTAHEIMLLKHGLVLPTGTPGSKIAKALDELSRPEWIHEPHNAFSGPWRIVDFVTANSS